MLFSHSSCRLVASCRGEPFQQSPHRPEPRLVRHQHVAQQRAAARQQATRGTATRDRAPQGAAPQVPAVTGAEGPLAAAKSFFLPRGFPNSVTEDYLPYQLLTIPAHITGWLSHSLATSSMITALAVSSGPAATVGITAAIKWITKDGVGAVGRLVVGGRLSSYFDEDPKRWRMIAEFITTLGLALEIATQISPSNFVVLAGAGTLARATAKGIGRPCFRVVQTHFAASNNVGDVAAKEEVWEVSAQMVGIAASVAVLGALDAADMQQAVIPLWAGVHALHVALRYQALTTLRLPWPNQKRAAALMRAHVAGAAVPGVTEVNRAEPMLLSPGKVQPAVELGCSLEQLLAWQPPDLAAHAGSSVIPVRAPRSSSSRGSGSDGAAPESSAATGGSESAGALGRLLTLYASERYVLTWQGGVARVLLWQDAGPLDMLRAMWQAARLDQQLSHGHHHQQQQQPLATPAAGPVPAAAAAGETPATLQQLERSLREMQEGFPDLERQAALRGWKLGKAVLLSGPTRLQRQEVA